MREIKFRAWDEKEKCWVCGFAIHQNGMFSDWAGCKEVNGKCYADANWEQLKNIPNIKIMQYTGLKDKNGKEIYEGDIILFNNFGNTLDKVVYSQGCFRTLRRGYLLDKIREIEIIGNIYEHPHLLKEGVTL